MFPRAKIVITHHKKHTHKKRKVTASPFRIPLAGKSRNLAFVTITVVERREKI